MKNHGILSKYEVTIKSYMRLLITNLCYFNLSKTVRKYKIP